MTLERFTLDTYDRKSVQANPISSNAMGVNTKISNRTMKNINEFNKRLSATQVGFISVLEKWLSDWWKASLSKHQFENCFKLSTIEGRIDEISETSSQVSSIPRNSGRRSST